MNFTPTFSSERRTTGIRPLNTLYCWRKSFVPSTLNLEKSNTKTMTRDGRKLVMDVQGVASTLAYFGKKPFEANPNILEDLVTFNRYGFWSMLLSVPRFLYPKPYRARDRILAAFQGLFDTIDAQDDVSDFIRSRHKLVAEKMDENTQAPDKFNIFFG